MSRFTSVRIALILVPSILVPSILVPSILVASIPPVVVVAEEREPRQVMSLHTEFFPYRHKAGTQLSFRMTRELARQSFLVAAHHDFGIATRDETLGETVPDGKSVTHLVLLERLNPSSNEDSWTTRSAQRIRLGNAFSVGRCRGAGRVVRVGAMDSNGIGILPNR